MNVVVAVPDGVVVWAVVVIVAWIGTSVLPLPPVTSRVAVPTLLLVSVAVIVTSPERPCGTVTYAMNAPPGAVRAAGVVVTICPPTWTTMLAAAVYPLPRSCTVFPTAAVAGDKVSVGVVSVMVALAELPAASVIVSVFVAVAVIGRLNVAAGAAEIPPVPVVVVEPAAKVTA